MIFITPRSAYWTGLCVLKQNNDISTFFLNPDCDEIHVASWDLKSNWGNPSILCNVDSNAWDVKPFKSINNKVGLSWFKVNKNRSNRCFIMPLIEKHNDVIELGFDESFIRDFDIKTILVKSFSEKLTTVTTWKSYKGGLNAEKKIVVNDFIKNDDQSLEFKQYPVGRPIVLDSASKELLRGRPFLIGWDDNSYELIWTASKSGDSCCGKTKDIYATHYNGVQWTKPYRIYESGKNIGSIIDIWNDTQKNIIQIGIFNKPSGGIGDLLLSSQVQILSFSKKDLAEFRAGNHVTGSGLD